jgi:penicillin-binding protein 1A
MSKEKKEKKEKKKFGRKTTILLILLIWLIGLSPMFGVLYLRYVSTDDSNLPSAAILENQEELLATTVYADDGSTELGKYWKVNRTSVQYNEISPFVISALISTEDERFKEHAGIDAKAVARAIKSMGGAGGASTITQQLAKLIFTLQEREEKKLARLENGGDALTKEEKNTRKMGVLEKRLYEKVKENVIALRLEKRYTKEEILTMYLNQFDFISNAVGIATAARVYYNKSANDLAPEEAAMLVGMCKNPSLYNPYTFKVKNYRSILASRKDIAAEEVTTEQIKEARAKDSTRAANRRNTVLYKWYENSEKDNKQLLYKLSKKEYDSLKMLPILTNYQRVDHKSGLAPYFRESLRSEVTKILGSQDEDGNYIYTKENGRPYYLYEDGLKIYTTLSVDIQKHAENALKKHLSKNLQKPFDKNNRRMKNFPFDNRIDEETVDLLMNSAIKRSDRYRNLKNNGLSEAEIMKTFEKPSEMRIFSWEGEIDTVLTPLDSIRYYKNIMRAGLVSIEPQTGFIKAWVGGPDINHFGYDHVRQGKRQVGSTIKPFIYSAGMRFGVITECETTPNIEYCVDVQTGPRPTDMTSWCPKNAGVEMDGKPTPFGKGLASSMNNLTVAVMARMGGTAGPRAVAKLMRDLNIEIREEDVVPAMCLGVMDLSLLELTSAQAAFVNKGIYTKPTTIMRIEDRNGNVIYESFPDAKEVMSEELAYATLNLMKRVVYQGTGASLRGTWREWGGITHPTAGKTGTTQNNSDGWFMALTPDLVTGVWVGAEDMAIRFRSMQWGQGARMALPIYGYMMQEVYKDANIQISTKDFEVPIGYENSVYNCKENPNNDNQNLQEQGGFGI